MNDKQKAYLLRMGKRENGMTPDEYIRLMLDADEYDLRFIVLKNGDYTKPYRLKNGVEAVISWEAKKLMKLDTGDKVVSELNYYDNLK